jgi:hypothetical protein
VHGASVWLIHSLAPIHALTLALCLVAMQQCSHVDTMHVHARTHTYMDTRAREGAHKLAPQFISLDSQE